MPPDRLLLTVSLTCPKEGREFSIWLAFGLGGSKRKFDLSACATINPFITLFKFSMEDFWLPGLTENLIRV